MKHKHTYSLDELKQLKQSDLNPLREQLFTEQNGKCKICQNDLDVRTHIDHQHMTSKETLGENGAGLIRGLVCASCNNFEGKIWNNAKRFGKFDDLLIWLENLVNYYKEPNLPLIHPNEKPKVRKIKKSCYNKLVKVYNGKAKLPVYTGNLSKKLEELFVKYAIEIEYYN